MTLKKSVFILLATILVSCGSSIESEQLSWDRKAETVKEYSAAYPHLQSEINQQYQLAVAAMHEAENISNEEDKIKAMQAANALALKGTLGKIIELEEVIEDVEDKIKEIKDEFTAEEFSQKTNFLLEEANDEISAGELALTSNESSAKMLVIQFEKSAKKLKEVERSLDNHYSEIQEQRDELEKETQTAEEKSDNDQVAPIADINCKKCGGKVKGDEVKCSNCGAPVKK